MGGVCVVTFSLASNRIGLAFLEALPRGVVMLVNHAFISKEMFDWHVGAVLVVWCHVLGSNNFVGDIC